MKNESLIRIKKESLNNMPPPFSEDDFKKIISAYKEIFPDPPTPELELMKYFNFDRNQKEREWSYICSNFHEIAKHPEEYYESIKKYGEELRGLIESMKNSNYTVCEIANKIKELINGSTDYKHFGSAIGINTYTDELLLRSKNENEGKLPKEIVVVLAHDWYPIVSTNKEIHFIPPLEGYSIFVEKGKNGKEIERDYGKMIKLIGPIPTKYTILFMNLFPDYRKPGVSTMGPISGVDYEGFANGIINLIKSISSKFTVKCIITWGVIPFSSINEYHSPDKKYRKMKNIIEGNIRLKAIVDQLEIPLIPSYHPSNRYYYNKSKDYLIQILNETLCPVC